MEIENRNLKEKTVTSLPDRVTKGVFVTLLAFVCACAVLAFISCGMVVSDPEDVNGSGEVSIVFEVTGTVSTAGIIVRGNDNSLLIGTEAEDGTAAPEEIPLPWTSEAYSYTGEQNVFFSISAKNTERQEKTSGTLTTYSDDRLLDAAADFTSDVSAGDYVYNADDDIFALITAVNSASDCSLNRVLFAESWRTYYIFQKGTTIASGTTTSTSAGELIDSGAIFTGKVDEDEDTAANLDTGAESVIADVDSTTLDLLSDIFQQLGGGEHYLIRRDENPAAGTTTSTSSFRLCDSAANFINDDVAAGLLAENADTGEFALIVSVSAEELTLDRDIFQITGQNYLIYTVKTSPAYSTTQEANKLRNSSASFFSGVKNGDVVYNPANDIYGKVDSVDSNIELTLDADVFPAVSIPYTVYAPRTLTVTVYVNGTAYDSFTSEHWDKVEASLTQVLTTAELNILAE